MIRINLLPVREERRKAGLRQQAGLLGVAAAVGVIISLGLYVSVNAQVGEERRMLSAANAELASLEETRKQVERFREEKEAIERKLEVIETLQASRSGPVRILDEIATRIPKRVWLTSLSMSGGTLELKGASLDAEIVASFLTALEETPGLSGVDLEDTTLRESDGLKLNVFKIRTHYQYTSAKAASGPVAQPAGTGF